MRKGANEGKNPHVQRQMWKSITHLTIFTVAVGSPFCLAVTQLVMSFPRLIDIVCQVYQDAAIVRVAAQTFHDNHAGSRLSVECRVMMTFFMVGDFLSYKQFVGLEI